MPNGVKSKAWTNVRPGTYSAWNWQTGLYDYYQGVESTVGYGDQVRHPGPRLVTNPVGETPEESAHPLPRGVRKVGSGPTALGEIVDASNADMGLAGLAGVALAIIIPAALLWVTANLGRFLEPREER
jgi:hypothetical protein